MVGCRSTTSWSYYNACIVSNHGTIWCSSYFFFNLEILILKRSPHFSIYWWLWPVNEVLFHDDNINTNNFTADSRKCWKVEEERGGCGTLLHSTTSKWCCLYLFSNIVGRQHCQASDILNNSMSQVAAGEVLCDIETDKATLDLECMEDGYVSF